MLQDGLFIALYTLYGLLVSVHTDPLVSVHRDMFWPDAPPSFFHRCARVHLPTHPPAVPSRAPMNKIKTGCSPWPYMANIWPRMATAKKKLKLAIYTDYVGPYIRIIYGHIYGLYWPNIQFYPRYLNLYYLRSCVLGKSLLVKKCEYIVNIYVCVCHSPYVYILYIYIYIYSPGLAQGVWNPL